MAQFSGSGSLAPGALSVGRGREGAAAVAAVTGDGRKQLPSSSLTMLLGRGGAGAGAGGKGPAVGAPSPLLDLSTPWEEEEEEDESIDFKEEDLWPPPENGLGSPSTEGSLGFLPVENDNAVGFPPAESNGFRHPYCYLKAGFVVPPDSNNAGSALAKRDGGSVKAPGIVGGRFAIPEHSAGLSSALDGRMGPGLTLSSLSSSSSSFSNYKWNRTQSARHLPSASKTIPVGPSLNGDLGPAAGEMRSPARGDGRLQHHQSAPVNIPDWSQILKTSSSSKKVADSDLDPNGDPVDLESGEGGEKQRLPPHELLAREQAHSQAMRFSMCEGIGRTLKGRDLSRVRNAVLRQTGFID